jgi:Holliday junction resolvase
MLHLDKEEVKITDEGMCFDEVKELYNTDRQNSTKPYFKKCITYIYWAYKKDGEYKHQLPTRRKELAAKKANCDWKEIEENVLVKNFIKLYLELQTTQTERLYLAVMKDIEDLIEYLSTIGFKKRVKVKFNVPIPKYKDSTETMLYELDDYVEVDNTDEKFKALKRSADLLDFVDSLKIKMKKEEQTIKNNTIRTFDSREANE